MSPRATNGCGAAAGCRRSTDSRSTSPLPPTPKASPITTSCRAILDLGVTWREAWRRYIGAAHKYHQPGSRLFSLAEHHEMLLELGGNLFCLFPEVDWSMRRCIAHFGALDLF